LQGIKNFDGVKGVKEALEGELRERGEEREAGVRANLKSLVKRSNTKLSVKRSNTKSLVKKLTMGSPTQATTANIAGKADLSKPTEQKGSKLTVQKVSKLTVQKLKPCIVDGETQTTVAVEIPELGIYKTNMMQI
jgi:hypothetical protein